MKNLMNWRKMRKPTYTLLAISGMLVLSGWLGLSEPPIKKAEWLIGTWGNKTARGTIYETWTKINSHELSGKSYILKENDTIVFETTRLIQQNDSLFYIATVKNQNNGLPVRFAMKTISDKSLVFENEKHDFPQIISYFKIASDSLVAEISGTKNGQERKQTFPMKRVR